ncbi:MAG: hypothetical protein RLZZ135_1164 [Cyanobacteriota bacterium]
MFPDAGFSPYIAKTALMLDGAEIAIGYIPSDCIQSLWSKYPEIQSHLNQCAEHLEGVIQGEIEPSAILVHKRSTLVDRQIQTRPAIVTEARSNLVIAKTTPATNRIKEAYFPTPNQRMGQWWQKATHNYPFYAQHNASDCGAACLVMIGRYWGKAFNINHLRESAHVSRDGASLKGLTTAAEKLGFNVRPVKANLKLLAKQKLPAIAHWEGNHY